MEEILIQRLYQYMQFTVELEQTVVIPVATMLSRGISGFDLPVVMRADAFKIVTDEAWHAQCAFDMLSQIREATQVEPHLPARPQFISRLADLAVHLDSETHTCRDILFCIISETLISSILSDIPQDTRLHGAVRAVIADHAEDEGKHHAYFHALLEYFWPSLTVDQQRELGRQIPMLIRIFLEPDYGALSGALSAIGLGATEVSGVLAESYPEESVVANVSLESQSCMRYLREIGALDDQETAESFARAGLG